MNNNANIMNRAFSAYFRSGGTEQPSTADSGVSTVNGRHYAVLRNTNKTLKVYRVLNSGKLKAMKVYPDELRSQKWQDTMKFVMSLKTKSMRNELARGMRTDSSEDHGNQRAVA